MMAFSVLAIVLAVAAAAQEQGSAMGIALWLASLAAGTLALLALYGVGITWARHRKRLWG